MMGRPLAVMTSLHPELEEIRQPKAQVKLIEMKHKYVLTMMIYTHALKKVSISLNIFIHSKSPVSNDSI